MTKSQHGSCNISDFNHTSEMVLNCSKMPILEKQPMVLTDLISSTSALVLFAGISL